MDAETKANSGRIGTIQKHIQRNEKAKSQADFLIYFHKVTPSVPASPGPFSTFERARSIPPFFPPQPTQCEENEDEHLNDDMLSLDEQ